MSERLIGSVFLSTLSLRRATCLPGFCRMTAEISIHALLAESDPRGDSCYLDNIDFYPRSPCGERHHQSARQRQGRHFYPRSPCGERRGNCPSGCQRPCISIHALLAESDHSRRSRIQRHPNFYPRSPCGERRQTAHQ